MNSKLRMILGLLLIPALLNGADWIVINHTPFAMTAQFGTPGGDTETAKIDPYGEYKYTNYNISKVIIQGMHALPTRNYFGGNESTIILKCVIEAASFNPRYWTKSQTFDVFAQFGDAVNKALPIILHAKKGRFFLIQRGFGIVSTSPWYDAKTGSLVIDEGK